MPSPSILRSVYQQYRGAWHKTNTREGSWHLLDGVTKQQARYLNLRVIYTTLELGKI